MKKTIIILTIVILTLLLTSCVFATTVNMEKEYTATELNELILKINNSYPEKTELETIGYSTANNTPIYALRVIGNSVKNYDSTKRKQEGINNYLILGGTHAREIINTQLLLKQIENYLENDTLDENVILHYIPLINPDGYDISLHSEVKDHKIWKANGVGVDINRNFPSIYYSSTKKEWVDYWGRMDKTQFIRTKPGPRYYFGEYAGSEKETQAVMNYMNQYSFAMMVDYHSQGEVVFWEMWTANKGYEDYNRKLADVVKNTNGYKPYINYSDEHGSGYSTDYFASIHYTPAITVETTKAPSLPFVSADMRNAAYTKNKNTTLNLVKYNEIHLPELRKDYITLYTAENEEFGKYPKEVAEGYKARYNLTDIKPQPQLELSSLQSLIKFILKIRTDILLQQ